MKISHEDTLLLATALRFLADHAGTDELADAGLDELDGCEHGVYGVDYGDAYFDEVMESRLLVLKHQCRTLANDLLANINET